MDTTQIERAGTPASPSRFTVALAEDPLFFRARLSWILREGGFEVLVPESAAALPSLLGGGPVHLVILPLRRPVESILEHVRAVAGEAVPILGICGRDRSQLDLRALRSLGVVGLLDQGASPEQVVFRVNQLTRKSIDTRRFQRAPACFPVEVELADGGVRTEYAETLSAGGLGLATAELLEPNSDVVLRFRLEDRRSPLFEMRARVIHSHRRRGIPAYQAGVFFYPIDAETMETLAREVARLLDDGFEVLEGRGRDAGLDPARW